MSEENRPNVNVKADAATTSLGKDAAYAAQDATVAQKNPRALVYVVMLFVVGIGLKMFFSKNQKIPTQGGSIPTPGMSYDSSGINPKLLTERDLTNVIKRPSVERSFLGKIKVVSLRSISELPIGSEMKAVLVSGATDGIVKAKLTSALIVDGEPALPENAVLFGKGKSSEERLFIEFSKVILPTGESYSIRAQAFDVSDKIQGLKGAFVGTRAKKMAGAVAFGFMGGMADGLQESSGSYFVAKKPTARDAALAGASKAALDQSAAYMEEMKKSPNIIEVKSGTELLVITDEPRAKKETYEKN